MKPWGSFSEILQTKCQCWIKQSLHTDWFCARAITNVPCGQQFLPVRGGDWSRPFYTIPMKFSCCWFCLSFIACHVAEFIRIFFFLLCKSQIFFSHLSCQILGWFCVLFVLLLTLCFLWSRKLPVALHRKDFYTNLLVCLLVHFNCLF